MALWDGGEGRGRGGTAEIIRHALSLDIPVWWIPLQGGPGRWLTQTWHFAMPERAPAGATAEDALERHILALLVPPASEQARDWLCP